jgi:calcineurin-like phosphoesterase family protein
MSNNFFTSDCHFGHTNIMKYSGRPFDNVKEMDEMLIANWNKTIGEQDNVYFLGDFTFRGKDEVEAIVSRLNGHIHWVYGNHDKTKGGKAAIKANGFVWKGSYKEIKINGQNIMLFHYAQLVWNKCHYGSWSLVGHSHGSLRYILPDNIELAKLGLPVLQLDVGVDVAYKHLGEFRPFAFEEVKEIMESKKLKVEEAGLCRQQNLR